MSDASRWQLVKDFFQAALERPPEARAAFLDEACTDVQLRHDVDALLASHEEAGGFLESPAVPQSTVTAGTR